MTETYELELAAEIVSAYVRNNALRADDLPGLIAQVHGALVRVAAGADGGGGRAKACGSNKEVGFSRFRDLSGRRKEIQVIEASSAHVL